MRVAAALSILLAAGSALAQEDGPRPDYSHDALLRLFVQRDEPRPLPQKRVRWHLGYVEFRAWNMEWRVLYLPIAMPLAGSRMRDLATPVNPLAQFGPPYANSNGDYMRRPRDVDREIRRVLALEKRAKVKVQ